MSYASTVIPPQFVSIFNLVNPEQLPCFHASLSVGNTDNLIHSRGLSFVSASHSPAHVFRVFIPSLLGFNAVTTNERG